MEQPSFGGEPGEPVPQVDPEDLKAVWQFFQEARVGSENVAIGTDILLQRVCKHGADIQAVSYRVMMLTLLTRHAPEQLAPWSRGATFADSVFCAAAKTPMEWIGVGKVRNSLPFELDEFLRLCREQTGSGNPNGSR